MADALYETNFNLFKTDLYVVQGPAPVDKRSTIF